MSGPDPGGPAAEVAPGVYRFGSRRVNWYVLEGDDGLAVVDAGVPGHWDQLVGGLEGLGHGLDDVAALLLTHGHPDHVGFAERLREAADVPVFVHEADASMARGEGPGAPAGDLFRNLWRPAVLALLVELARGGGTSIAPVSAVQPVEGDQELDVPGAPQVIHLPGHSPGSCAYHLPHREVLVCGDALATLDLTTGRERGPQVMPMFNADREQAIESLDRLASLGEVTLLPGHGAPWRGDAAAAVRLARGR